MCNSSNVTAVLILRLGLVIPWPCATTQEACRYANTRCAHKEPDAPEAGRVVPSYCKPVAGPVDMNSCRNGWMDAWDRLPVDRLVQRPRQGTAILVLATESLKHCCLVQVMQQLGVLDALLPHEEPGDRVAFVTPGFSTMASFFTNPVRLPTPSGCLRTRHVRAHLSSDMLHLQWQSWVRLPGSQPWNRLIHSYSREDPVVSPAPVLTATRWRVECCVRQCSGLPASEKVTGTLRISRSTLRSKLVERFPGSNISYGKTCAAVDVVSGGEGPPVQVTFQVTFQA